MHTIDPDTIGRMPERTAWEIYTRNPALHAAIPTFRSFRVWPEVHIMAHVFPPDRTPDGYRPLLPAQVLAAGRAMVEMDARGPDDDTPPDPDDDTPERRPAHRAERIRPTGRHAVTMRDGALVEPLAHRTDRGPRARRWPLRFGRTAARLGRGFIYQGVPQQ